MIVVFLIESILTRDAFSLAEVLVGNSISAGYGISEIATAHCEYCGKYNWQTPCI
jgi:hypothetical protein